MLNRQQPFGADVISRISATMLDDDGARPPARPRARDARPAGAGGLRGGGRRARRGLRARPRRQRDDDAARRWASTPSPSAWRRSSWPRATTAGLRATDLGVRVHPRAPATVFPALGAYVGGDIVAGLLATGMNRDKRLRLFIDVGTNCEIALGSQERLVTTAAPAGPAFEAAQIRCGMRAADGAIEVVKIDDGRLELGVIGDVEPVGMCGSGLVDTVAELVKAGLLDRSGRLAAVEDAARSRRRWPTASWRWRAASASSCCTGRARTATSSARSTSPSATCASCSSPRPRSRRAGRCCWRSSASSPRDIQQVLLAGLVRLLPVAGQRGPHRPGAEAAGGAHRLGGQRGRRGREDGAAVPAGAGGRPGPAGGGRVRRAVRPRRTSTTASSSSSRSRDSQRELLEPPRSARQPEGVRPVRAASDSTVRTSPSTVR